MRDQGTIETLTVNSAETAIARCPHLSCEFKQRDKTPSWDGFIFIHKNSNKDKKGLTKVSVQIKGTECESFCIKELSYRAEVEDLRNYLHNGGVLFFVVELNSDDNTKIFYETLLPIKLQSLLDEVNTDQQYKTIHLKPLPEDKSAIETIVKNFSQDAHKQTSFAESELMTLNDLPNNHNVEKIIFSTTKCGVKPDDRDFLSPFFENELCGYVQMKGSKALEPLKETLRPIKIIRTEKKPICVDGRVFYNQFTWIQTKDSISYHFGGIFETKSTDGGVTGKIRIFRKAKTIDEQILALDFIKAIQQSRSFTIGEQGYHFGDEIPFANIDYENQISIYDRISAMLSALRVKKQLDLSLLTNEDIVRASFIAISILEHRPITELEMKPPFPVTLDYILGSLRIKLFVSKSESQKGLLFENFFDSEQLYKLQVIEKATTPSITIPAAYLTIDEISSLSNLDSQYTLNQLRNNRYDNSASYLMVNEFLNRVLIAYDICKRPELIELADGLAKWLLNKDIPGVTQLGKEIDILQIASRTRKLTRQERNTLEAYLDETEFAPMDLIGVYLLLGKKKEAKFVYKELMDFSTQKCFNESPLHRFWK